MGLSKGLRSWIASKVGPFALRFGRAGEKARSGQGDFVAMRTPFIFILDGGPRIVPFTPLPRLGKEARRRRPGGSPSAGADGALRLQGWVN